MAFDFNSLTKEKKIEIVKSDSFQKKLLEAFLEFVNISRLPITGLAFEERFNKALEKINYTTGFTIGNHSPDADICGFSLKGNRIYKKKTRMTNITSYRTSHHKTLADKLNYIKAQNEKNCGYILCLREDVDNDTKYLVYFLENSTEFFKIDNYAWRKRFTKEGKRHVGYTGYSDALENYLTIEYPASHQFFIRNLNVDAFDKNPKITKILELNVTNN